MATSSEARDTKNGESHCNKCQKLEGYIGRYNIEEVDQIKKEFRLRVVSVKCEKVRCSGPCDRSQVVHLTYTMLRH